MQLLRWTLACCVCFGGQVLCGSSGANRANAAEYLDAATVMPSGAVAYVEIDQLQSWIQKTQEAEWVKKLPDHPQVKAFYKSAQGQQAEAGRRILEAQLGMDLWTLAKNVLGGRISAAFYPLPGRKEPDVVLLLQAPEAAALESLREKVQPFIDLAQDRIETSTGPGDLTIRGIDRKLFVAEKEHWVLLSSSKSLIEKTLHLKAKTTETPALANDAPYAAMTQRIQQRVAQPVLARAYLNTDLVRQAQNGRVTPEKLDNGAASLLGGGFNELLNHASFLALTFGLSDERLGLTLHLGAKSSAVGAAHQPFFPPADKAVKSLPEVPGLLAGWTLNRDFAGWYQRREELLQARVLPEFDKFESGLANILPNRDFGTDILPSIGRNITLLAAPQSFEHLDAKPGVQLPAFGLVIDLAKPTEGAETLQLLFQTLISITNLNAGQQGRQPWLLTSETYRDVSIQSAKYSQKPKGDRLPIVFNFMPAAARVAQKYVLCSSVELCRQLIDAYAAAQDKRVAPKERVDQRLEFRGEPIAQALAANHELLVARGVQEGKSAEQAEFEFKAFLDLVRAIRAIRVAHQESDAGYEINLEANWSR